MLKRLGIPNLYNTSWRKVMLPVLENKLLQFILTLYAIYVNMVAKVA